MAAHSRDGTLDIPYLMPNGKWETLSKHEYDLLTRISQELRLAGTHILNLEEAMMAYGKVYDTLLARKKESSRRSVHQEWQEAYLKRMQEWNRKLDYERGRM